MGSGGGGGITKTIGDFFGGGAGQMTESVGNAVANAPRTPQTLPPDPGAIREQEVENQVKDEDRLRASSTLFTGASGLLDTPSTASRVLLGS